MSFDRTFERIFQAVAFLWPLWVVGIRIGGYAFTGATLLFIVLGIIVLVRVQFWKQTFWIGSLFLLWALLTAWPRFSVGKYLFSWLGLGAVLLPLFGTYPSSIRPRPILDALYWGCVVTLGFAAYELALSFIPFPPLDQVFPFGLWLEARTHEFLGITRVKSTMAEPAHYARYLVFVYAILDTATLYGYRIHREFLFKVAWGGALVSTLSLSGFVLSVAYFGTAFLVRRRHLLRRLFTLRFWLILTLVPPASVGALYFLGLTPYDLYDLFGRRLEQVVEVIQLGLIVGSEASRVQSMLVLFRYLGGQDLLHFLAGEGYAQASTWLIEQYGHLSTQLTSFARGDLHNAYSVVGMSTGVIGLALFLRFIWNLLSSRVRPIPVSIATLWIVARLGTGYLIRPAVWIPLLLSGLIFKALPVKENDGREKGLVDSMGTGQPS